MKVGGRILTFLLVLSCIVSFTMAETQKVENTEQNPPGIFKIPLNKDCTNPKSKLAIFIVSLLVGTLGIDRFYAGYIGMGVGKLLITMFTCGLCGWIW
jgi:hypothetical protein